MTTDSVTLHADQQILKMGLSIHTEGAEKFNDIAPMIILEPADQFYDSEQVIISNELAITDSNNGKYETGNAYVNKAYDQTHFSITVIDNEKVDDELMDCFESIQTDNFNVLNEVTDYNEMAAVNEMSKYLIEEIRPCESSYLMKSPDSESEFKGGTAEINENVHPKEEGSLDCILKNLLIEPKSVEVSDETVPLLNGCKRPAFSMDCSPTKKVKSIVDDELGNGPKSDLKTAKSFEIIKQKKESILSGENIQILKIETKPPKPTSADKDLTSLNWLQKLNIVSVPSLPTPPSSPTFQKNNCKKANSFSLRLQYG